MFSNIFGKKRGDASPVSKVAVHSRGLEVIEEAPDTAWGRWDDAVYHNKAQKRVVDNAGGLSAAASHVSSIEVQSKPTGSTRPIPLSELAPEQRKDRALEIIQEHHPRIASTIRSLWGYPECSSYVNKLIMEGYDGKGQARTGFNQTAVEAMMALTEVHDHVFEAHRVAGPHFNRTGHGWDFAT